MTATALQTAGAPRPRKALVADLFCGAGGSSTGAKRALCSLGYEMDLVCVNHWPTAIDTHSRNHPEARHYCQDVSTVRPHLVVPEGKLDLLMASPTCTFHSRARGGKPISDQQRMDPWHIITWLTELRVKRLIIENVPEFTRWGPVNARTGRPIKSREGEYFVQWANTIRNLGANFDFRILNCANYGDATTRERFFGIATWGGLPLRWPNATHARKGKVESLFDAGLEPWRAAREIIDWSLKGQSIFNRKRPLSPKTLARIHAGAVKFGWPEPFLVVLRNHMGAQSISEPLPTITAGGTHIGVVQPFVLNRHGDNGGHCRATTLDDPLPTVTTSGGGYLAEPFVMSGHAGGAPRSVEEPIPGMTAMNNGPLVVEPLVISTRQHTGGRAPRSSAEPVPTITATDSRIAVVEPMIAPYYGSGSGESCTDIKKPLPSVTTKGRFGLVMPAMHRRFDILFRMLEPHELAAAMGFNAEDQKYEFAGTKTDIIRQIGNAVPCNTAAALVRALMEM